MSTLGQILATLQDRSEVITLLAEAGDITAIAGLEQAARETGQDIPELALGAVRDFTERADNEAWVKLVGRLQNAEAPGAACLSEIISWSLAR